MRHWTWRNFACVWVCVCVRRLVWQAKLIIIRRACSKSNNFACFITPALTHAYTTQTPTRSHTHKHIRRDMYICEPDMLACCNKIRLTTNRAICSAWWDFVRFFFYCFVSSASFYHLSSFMRFLLQFFIRCCHSFQWRTQSWRWWSLPMHVGMHSEVPAHTHALTYIHAFALFAFPALLHLQLNCWENKSVLSVLCCVFFSQLVNCKCRLWNSA